MPINPLRGEVWFVNLDPTRGSELQKTRRVLIVSAEGIGILPLRLVVPFTAWNDSFAGKVWLVKIEANPRTGLTKPSAADVFQMRSVDLSRFGAAPLGQLSDEEIHAVTQAIAVSIDYEANPS